MGDWGWSQALDAAETALEGRPRAAMFELARRGHASLFEQLVSCILSIRTYDEVSLPASLRLFAHASGPAAVAALGEEAILEIIASCTYAERKAGQIAQIARTIVEEYGGELPEDEAIVRGFKGVGPKCANLALGIGAGQPRVSVDVHVHRVTARWGATTAPTPERAAAELERAVPERLRVDVNRVLMPFGKFICTRARPKCGGCPLRAPCPKIGLDAEDTTARPGPRS